MKTRFYLLLIITVFCSNLPAQTNPVVDSLKTILPDFEGEDRVDILNHLSIIITDKAEGLEYMREAKEIALALDYEMGLADITGNYGLIQYRQKEYDSALTSYRLALSLFKEAGAGDHKLGLSYHRIASAYKKLGVKDSAIVYYRKAVSHLSKTEEYLLEMYANSNMALLFGELAEYDSALVHFKEAYRVAEENNIEQRMASNLNSIGIIYWQRGMYDMAIENYLKSIEIRERIHDLRGQSLVYNNIGVAYKEYGDTTKALNYFYLGLEKADSAYNSYALGYSYSNIGRVFRDYEAVDSALYYFNKSLKTYEDIDNRDGIMMNMIDIGRVYIIADDHQKAVKILNDAVDMARKEQSVMREAQALKALGTSYHKRGNTGTALQHLSMALDLAQSIKQRDLTKEIYQVMSEIFQEVGRTDKAFEFYKEFVSLKDSLYTEKFENKLLNYQHQLEMQKAELNLAEKEIELQQQTYIIITGAIIILLLVIGSIVLYRLYLSRKRLSDKLNELNASKDRFFSIIAHDLKSPFTSLIGLTDLLRYEYDSMSDEELKRMLTDLNTGAVKTYKLLQNLLQWSRSQTGRMEFNPKDLNLNNVISQDLEVAAETARNKSIEIHNHVDSDLKVNADQEMLQTIFRNLISNAIKFTRENGKIDIDAEQKNGLVEISVKDNGIGMDEELRENLFRIDKNVSRKGTAGEESSGLGLVLCKEFIEKHGGDIKVKSARNEGSEFSFTLPRPNSE